MRRWQTPALAAISATLLTHCAPFRFTSSATIRRTVIAPVVKLPESLGGNGLEAASLRRRSMALERFLGRCRRLGLKIVKQTPRCIAFARLWASVGAENLPAVVCQLG